MKKLIAALAATMAFGAAPAAADEVVRVDDPTPNGAFTGSYDCAYHTYDEQGNATKVERTCSQAGYVAVYDDGIVACNGNEAVARPDNGEPLQGYVWIGPGHAAEASQTFAAPGNAFGAGNNLATDDSATQGTDEAHGPCEDPAEPRP